MFPTTSLCGAYRRPMVYRFTPVCYGNSASSKTNRFFSSFRFPGHGEVHNKMMQEFMEATEIKPKKRFVKKINFGGLYFPKEGTKEYAKWERRVLKGLSQIDAYNEMLGKTPKN